MKPDAPECAWIPVQTIYTKENTMTRKHTCLLIAAIFSCGALPALAQTATPNLDKREANQQRRIDKGVNSGQLTAPEAKRLERRADRLEKHEAKAKSDGVVTPQERARLQREANRNSREIRRETHDRQQARK